METETLSNYQSTPERHLHLEENMNTNDGLSQSGKVYEESSEGSESIELTKNEKSNFSESKDCDLVTNNIDKDNIKQGIAYESDNDVEEEEEHIPLNIIETNSDLEKSDDELDEADLLNEEDVDDRSEKDENEVINDHDAPNDEESHPDEHTQKADCSDANPHKGSERDENEPNTEECSEGNHSGQNGNEAILHREEILVETSSALSKENDEDITEFSKEKDEDITETPVNEDPLDTKDKIDEDITELSKEKDEDITEIPVNEDPLDTKDIEGETEKIEQSNPLGLTETTKELVSNDNVIDTLDNMDVTNDAKEENQENTEKSADNKTEADNTVEDKMGESNENAPQKTSNKEIDDVTADVEKVGQESTEESVEGNIEQGKIKEISEDEPEKNCNEEIVDVTDKVKEESTQKSADHKMDTGDAGEEKIDKNSAIEPDKSSNEIIDGDSQNDSNKVEEKNDKTSETLIRNDEKLKIKDKENSGLIELSEDNEKDTSKPIEAVTEKSLLKESLTRSTSDDGFKLNEGEEDEEMDEDFDPSLLCPDIDMEVDEAPVITSSDAPPPPRDGNKSPLLYEPIFSTFVDEMTGAEVSFNLTPDEEALRLHTFGDKNPVQFTKIHCTACNIHLGSALDGQGNRFVHPLLKVLICQKCYHFYTSGEFEKDEDGSELYCRWCGQGGQVMCCSNCEMVFCKKCIRINFDRKKLAEIRDSDDWFCFKCNPSQLMFQRVHCAEFMEYVRREISRVATLENSTSYMNTDYTHCCTPVKKKQPPEVSPGEPKKKRRKVMAVVDPDYDPKKEREEESANNPPSTGPQPSTSGYRIISPSTPGTSGTSKMVPIVPKPNDPNKNGGMVQVNSSNSFKIGSTTFKPRTQGYTPRPRVQVIGSGSQGPRFPASSPRPANASPGYIKILPGGIRVPGNMPTPRNYNPNNTVRQTTPMRPATATRPGVQIAGTHMKHEWFEKTVRAAARVNSNLSYTLTQLNRAQANATSVEALAVVHNKLQEILSTSINSLIQIRKNLRTEFIAGIKNIRFPPRPQVAPTPSAAAATAASSSSSQDDDVIFISPATSPIPPPLPATPVTTSSSSLNLPPSISLTRKQSPSSSATPIKTTTALNSPKPSTSQERNGTPKSFLRVKSLVALQNVSAECITIPDDPPPPPLTPIKRDKLPMVITEDGDKDLVIIDDKEDGTQENKMVNGMNNDGDGPLENSEASTSKKDIADESNDGKEVKSADYNEKPLEVESDDIQTKSYNIQLVDPVIPELKKMMAPKILLQRSSKIDELVKIKFERMNGDLSE